MKTLGKLLISVAIVFCVTGCSKIGSSAVEQRVDTLLRTQCKEQVQELIAMQEQIAENLKQQKAGISALVEDDDKISTGELRERNDKIARIQEEAKVLLERRDAKRMDIFESVLRVLRDEGGSSIDFKNARDVQRAMQMINARLAKAVESMTGKK